MEYGTATVVKTLINDCVIVRAGEDLAGSAMAELKRVALEGIQAHGAKSIIFELSAVKFMDSCEFGELRSIAEMSRILGARPIFVGLKSGIITQIVNSDSNLAGIQAHHDLNQALERLGITYAGKK